MKKDALNSVKRRSYVNMAAKTMYIVGITLFFINLLFVLGGFYRDFFIQTFIYTFFLCALTVLVYIFTMIYKFL